MSRKCFPVGTVLVDEAHDLRYVVSENKDSFDAFGWHELIPIAEFIDQQRKIADAAHALIDGVHPR